MSNVKDGSAFENELVKILGERGMWASIFPKADDGSQPADIIAVNRLGKHLIDAKVCSNKRFVFSRAEDNQRSSMDFFKRRAEGMGWFAVKYPDGTIYMLPKAYIEYKEQIGDKSVGEIAEYYKLEYWLNVYCDIK